MANRSRACRSALLEQSLQNGRKVWQQRFGGQNRLKTEISALPNCHQATIFFPRAQPQSPDTPGKTVAARAQGIPVVYYRSAPIFPPLLLSPSLWQENRDRFRDSAAASLSCLGYDQRLWASQQVNLQVRNSAGIPLAFNTRFDSASGTFRILWVPAGTYILQADAPDQRGTCIS